MPIVINIDVMMAKRKIGDEVLSKRLGLSIKKLTILKKNKVSFIRLAVLNDICKELDCSTGDLLEYVDDETYKKLFGKCWFLDEE